jgi:hypothetical protein
VWQTVAQLSWVRSGFYSTPAAERQDPDFLIGPRNKKPRKKISPIEILLPPSQITSWQF